MSTQGMHKLTTNTYEWMSKMDVDEQERDNHEVYHKFFEDLKLYEN